MTLYINFENKQPAFYNDKIHSQDQIPELSREISEDVWIEFINNQDKKYIDKDSLEIKDIVVTENKIIKNNKKLLLLKLEQKISQLESEVFIIKIVDAEENEGEYLLDSRNQTAINCANSLLMDVANICYLSLYSTDGLKKDVYLTKEEMKEKICDVLNTKIRARFIKKGQIQNKIKLAATIGQLEEIEGEINNLA